MAAVAGVATRVPPAATRPFQQSGPEAAEQARAEVLRPHRQGRRDIIRGSLNVLDRVLTRSATTFC